MKVTPVTPIYKPQWVLTKPLTPVDPHRLELVPIQHEFIECTQKREEGIAWTSAFWMASCGALLMYIVLTGLIAAVRMVLGI